MRAADAHAAPCDADARPRLDDFIHADDLTALLRRAIVEDLGPDRLDATSALMIDERATATARLVARRPGRVAGLALLRPLIDAFDADARCELALHDADPCHAGDTLATLTGPTRPLLAIERLALNLLTHLSGVATLTAAFVEQTATTRARIYDTRKTLPGLRGLQKYAVACGGGHTHRLGLFDAVLIKDNHLAGVPPDALGPRVRQAAADARRRWPGLKFVEVEVDTLDQLDRVLDAGVDVVLLDNMSVEQLADAAARRDRLAPHVELEASGNVRLDAVAAVARAGVDRIAVGALTHSAPALDIGMDLA